MSAILEPALDKDEQALFDAMRDEKPAPAKEAPKDAPKEVVKEPAKEAAKDTVKEAPKDDGAKKESVVPAAALKEAREQNKALHKELDGLKELVKAGDTKLARFMEAVSKKADAVAPNFETDPAGALKAENEELKKGLAEVNARLAKQDEAGSNASKLQDFAMSVSAHEKEFAKENPDYFQAAEYVAGVWRDEFIESGFDEKQVPQMVFHKSLAMTHKAVDAGKNPAEAIYKIAKRNGFTTAAPKDEEKDDKKAEKPSGEAKLETIRKGQDAARVNGGGKGPDDLTLASIAQMDDDQIEKLVADPAWWSKNVRRSPLH